MLLWGQVNFLKVLTRFLNIVILQCIWLTYKLIIAGAQRTLELEHHVLGSQFIVDSYTITWFFYSKFFKLQGSEKNEKSMKIDLKQSRYRPPARNNPGKCEDLVGGSLQQILICYNCNCSTPVFHFRWSPAFARRILTADALDFWPDEDLFFCCYSNGLLISLILSRSFGKKLSQGSWHARKDCTWGSDLY